MIKMIVEIIQNQYVIQQFLLAGLESQYGDGDNRFAFLIVFGLGFL